MSAAAATAPAKVPEASGVPEGSSTTSGALAGEAQWRLDTDSSSRSAAAQVSTGIRVTEVEREPVRLAFCWPGGVRSGIGGGTAAERRAGAEPSREKTAGKFGENRLWNCRPRGPASSLLSETSRLVLPPESRAPGSATGSLVDDPDACDRASMVMQPLYG